MTSVCLSVIVIIVLFIMKLFCFVTNILLLFSLFNYHCLRTVFLCPLVCVCVCMYSMPLFIFLSWNYYLWLLSLIHIIFSRLLVYYNLMIVSCCYVFTCLLLLRFIFFFVSFVRFTTSSPITSFNFHSP